MSASFRLSGRSGKQVAVVGRHEHASPGLLVYSHDAVHRTYAPAKLSAPDGRTDLSEAFSSITAGEPVHNGGDTAYWTGSQVIGTTVDFASTAQANNGTASIDATGMSNNDTFALTAPAPINPTSYAFLEMYIYISTWSTQGTTKEIQVQCLNNGTSTGNTVSLSSYCDIATQGVWQLVLIPMTDFGITAATIDEIRFTCQDTGRGSPPAVYYDDMQFLGTTTTGVLTFEFSPRPEETVEIRGIEWDGVNGAKDKVVWNEFWGLTELTNGCTLTVRSGGRTAFTLLVRNIYDFGSIAPVRMEAIPSGSTGGIIKAYATLATEGLVLEGSKGDSISVTVRDDITALDRMSVALEAYYIDYNLEE